MPEKRTDILRENNTISALSSAIQNYSKIHHRTFRDINEKIYLGLHTRKADTNFKAFSEKHENTEAYVHFGCKNVLCVSSQSSPFPTMFVFSTTEECKKNCKIHNNAIKIREMLTESEQGTMKMMGRYISGYRADYITVDDIMENK